MQSSAVCRAEPKLRAKRGAKAGGEGGIRTPVPVTRQDAFEAPPLRPLRYLSVSYFARWGPFFPSPPPAFAGPTSAGFGGASCCARASGGLPRRSACEGGPSLAAAGAV